MSPPARSLIPVVKSSIRSTEISTPMPSASPIRRATCSPNCRASLAAPADLQTPPETSSSPGPSLPMESVFKARSPEKSASTNLPRVAVSVVGRSHTKARQALFAANFLQTPNPKLPKNSFRTVGFRHENTHEGLRRRFPSNWVEQKPRAMRSAAEPEFYGNNNETIPSFRGSEPMSQTS